MKRLALFLVSLLCTILWIVLMRKLFYPLENKDIVAFEFIGTAEKATAFLTGLARLDRVHLLTRSIYLDMVFPLLYGLSLWSANRWVWPESGSRTARFIGRFVPWAAVIALASDYIENVAMLNMIYHPPTDLAAAFAWWFASLKFSLIILLLILFGCGLLLRVIRSSGKAESL